MRKQLLLVSYMSEDKTTILEHMIATLGGTDAENEERVPLPVVDDLLRRRVRRIATTEFKEPRKGEPIQGSSGEFIMVVIIMAFIILVMFSVFIGA